MAARTYNRHMTSRTSEPGVSLPQRKRRPKEVCPNPLFAQWVEEWRDEAREKGTKAHYSYTKALNSLKKYPLPLSSGQEAKILDNIGEKLAKMLDKRLTEHLANGENHSSQCATSQGGGESGKPRQIRRRSPAVAKQRKTHPLPSFSPSYFPPSLSCPTPLCQSRQMDVELLSPSPQKKRKRTQREYIPVYRSGPYAILITLYTAEQRPGGSGFMCKSQLTKEAQPYCDTSFTVPEAGSYYTAWSSMSTLSKKNLVKKTSHPPKYSLTDAGVSLAMRLLQGAAEAENRNPTPAGLSLSPPPILSPRSPLSPTISTIASTQFHNSSCSPSVMDLTTEDVFDGNTGTGVDIVPWSNARPLISSPPSAPPSQLHQRPSEITLVDSDSDEEVAPLAERIGLRRHPPAKEQIHRAGVKERVEKTAVSQELTPSQMAGLAALRRLQQGTKDTGGLSASPQGSQVDSCSHGTPTIFSTSPPILDLTDDDSGSTAAVPMQTAAPLPAMGLTRDSSENAVIEAMQTTASSSSQGDVDLSSPSFILSPGAFEIVLCVDSSESSASRKSCSQFRGLLLQELGKNGVMFDVRRLNVGDFVWIARERITPRHGQLALPSSREVVLEYIVERKRMDDLAGSIIDGRFHEQKFRLQHCGVRRPIYLVEEYGDLSHLKLTKSALEQAVSNTQVINEFFVKRTKDVRESIAYLTIMTRYLQQHYAGKILKAYSCETVMELNKTSNQDKDCSVVCTMAFEQFNESSVKNKVLTVYEMFGRHLIQLPSMSADKAVAVLEQYPTISHLRNAYRQCKSEKEREKLIAEIRAGPAKRKLGLIVSQLIYSLYWKGN